MNNNNNSNNNNANNDPILDWILQGNLAEDTNKPMSTELLNFLLTQNVNVPVTTVQPQQQEKVSPEMTNNSMMNTSSPSEEEEEPTDAQLKMMPSKERRQLRNKISARNFRNRRKEYMATLEKEMDQCKAENAQLKLEVKWVRGMMDKLQAENDRLRLQLVLCKEGIEPTRNIDETLSSINTPSPEHPVHNTPASAATNSTVATTYTRTTNTNNSTLQLSPNSNNHNVYLAHASIPTWDMSSILQKDDKKKVTSGGADLIRLYPLLAPALMSIVVNHTMTMTTDEIIANSALYDPTWASTPSKNNKYASSLLSDLTTWQPTLSTQQQQQVKAITEASDAKTDPSQNKESTEEIDTVTWLIQNYCPMYWVQKQFCNFVISYVVVKYPHLDSKCRIYLPICEKFRHKKHASQSV